MLPASPLRHLLTLGILGAGATLLFATRPRLRADSASGQEQSASCLDNLSQISRAYALYARDFDGKIPLAVDPEDRFNTQIWNGGTGDSYRDYLRNAPFLHVVLRPYVASNTVFRCPSDAGWTESRLQIDASGSFNQGLKNVFPSSFAKYGTSYYSWTIYGFQLKTAADILNPARKTVLFDGDLWHQNAGRQRAGELFLDGHAENLSKAQHDAFAPDREF